MNILTKSQIEKIEKVLNKDEGFEDLKKELSREIGYFDKAGRYYLNDEFETETSRNLRSPSRSFPYSILKHVYTQKFWKAFSDEKGLTLEIRARKSKKDLIENIKSKEGERKVRKI